MLLLSYICNDHPTYAIFLAIYISDADVLVFLYSFHIFSQQQNYQFLNRNAFASVDFR